jgi:hypothetical protein
MCTYLLKMREYYRWEMGYPFSASLPKDELGAWLEQREQAWETLESAAFTTLPLNGREFDPFDSDAINRELQSQGMIYHAGLGSHATPHFFLGDLLRAEQRSGFDILVADREYARDLSAPPAMMLNGRIFVRRESLRRLLWERIEEWQWRRQESAMTHALALHDFDRDPDAALERMTDSEIEAVILHELGECLAGEQLGESWNDLLLAVSGSRAELMVRAVRDHLADCISTLPTLLADGNAASLHFYFANLKGMRRELFPRLLDAYRHWLDSGSLDRMKGEVRTGAESWRERADRLLEIYRRHGENSPDQIEQALADLPQSRQAPEQACACAPGKTV